MKLSNILGTACALALFATVHAQAATLANYPFTGSSLTSTDTDLTSAASAIALGSGLDGTNHFTAGANGNPAPALRIATSETDGTTFPTAITANDFFTFSITPAAGSTLALDAISFDLGVNSALINSNVRVQLSLNGTLYTNVGSITGFSTTDFVAERFDLSDANAALTPGAPVYLRFVIYDNANNAAGFTGIDNIVVTSIPEPRTNALLVLGVLGLTGFAVRRRLTV